MRRFLSLLLLPVLSLPALAGEPPQPDAAPAHHARVTWQQRFAQANTGHDGHLTREQAQGGYAQVAKHFDDIDVDHKGYVTENDIRAWRIMRKAAHRLTQPQNSRLKPHEAMYLSPVAHPASAPGATPVPSGAPVPLASR